MAVLRVQAREYTTWLTNKISVSPHTMHKSRVTETLRLDPEIPNLFAVITLVSCFLNWLLEGVTPGIREEREDLKVTSPSPFTLAPEERAVSESWWRMLLPSSLSAGQTAAVGWSHCHALCNLFRKSRPEKHACRGRAEAKAAPGNCFKDRAAPCGPHPLEPVGRTSPSQSTHERKP